MMPAYPYLPHNAAVWYERTRRPYITLTYAQSLDGCLALRQGEPSTISGEHSLRVTHQLRAAHDAILIGINTVLSDNPRLTTRLVSGPHPQPIVLDTRARFPAGCKLAAHPRGVWIASLAHKPDDPRVITVMPDMAGSRVSLPALLDELGQRGIQSLMVEGGAGVISAFLRERLANRVVVTIAPVFAGGYHAVQNLNTATWDSLPRLKNPMVERVGADFLIWGDL